MARLQISIRKPEGAVVRTWLNGQEICAIDVPKHSTVHIEIRQVREISEEVKKHLLKEYIMSFSTHGKVTYGNVIPNPFYATYEADIVVEDDFDLTFVLAACGVHYEIVCEEELALVKGSVRKKEENLHKNVWLQVMILMAIPIFLLIILALIAIWSGDVGQKGHIPMWAAIAFSVLFLSGGAFVVWQMIRRLR